MTRKLHQRGFLALFGFGLLLAGARPGLAQQLFLSTSKGCGDAAVFQVGEQMQITYGSNQTVNARLTVAKPDGTTVILFNGVLQAGVNRVFGDSVGAPEGPRTLTLTTGSVTTTCSYRAGAPGASTQEARLPGILDFYGTQEPVVAPNTVGAGEEFAVTITTFGGGCERQGDEGVLLGVDNATVLVYDFTSATTPDVPCTDILKQFTHTVRLRFTQPGEAVIRIWGRRVGQDAPPSGVPIVFERRITVQ